MMYCVDGGKFRDPFESEADLRYLYGRRAFRSRIAPGLSVLDQVGALTFGLRNSVGFSRSKPSNSMCLLEN